MSLPFRNLEQLGCCFVEFLQMLRVLQPSQLHLEKYQEFLLRLPLIHGLNQVGFDHQVGQLLLLPDPLQFQRESLPTHPQVLMVQNTNDRRCRNLSKLFQDYN